ncbi:hypothetical protein SKAU_G00069170 [Synaphobranchus kaupii]|uniref:Uncharacterized protein n=1 Tax=Synaphobranchus kaupii TaxID=118154 RepID=A0A9Q1JBJ9_SYNKA|nr:hypothetical protein SKAU_G00069170 [Synaphobranchus kaupii]
MDVHDGDAEKQCSVVIPFRKRRNNGMSRLVVALIIQSLFTTVCLAISIYSLRTVQSVEWSLKQLDQKWSLKQLDQEKDIGIYLEVMGEVRIPMEKPKFMELWKHKMELIENTTILFQCSGPYVVYVFYCSEDTNSPKNNGTLILQQPGIDRMIIPLYSQKDCDGENFQKPQKNQTMLSFTKNDTVSLNFTSDSLKLKYFQVRFHYLLGEQC